MANEFHNLEENLKAFLAEEQSDSYNTRSANLYKYNNLKIFVSPLKNSKPHFIIRIGISEAMYDIGTGNKLSGGLGRDERVIRRWLERGYIKGDLEQAWQLAKSSSNLTLKEESDE